MASEQQVALARAPRIPPTSSHISKAARQIVPAFLQKLYEMVNDPNNAELIRWSDAGDSFFVFDHERLAHEILGRWFKHRNFSSFVRQLNMYGFHKIPHLQQGVLKSDSDTEFWNFAHQNFHRGQPDLLCLIQRKKQIPQPGEDGAIDLRDPNAVGLLTGAGAGGAGPSGSGAGVNAQQGSPSLSSNQILDIHSIVNGIQAIKRHQTTISAELNELKRSNQLLWQDALAARAKHQKQQDTINRIVKFLAGVFGHHAAAGSASGVGVGAASPGVSGSPHGKDDLGGSELGVGVGVGPGQVRRRARLMIEDAKRDGPRKSMIEELTEMPIDADEAMYDSNYPTIETPLSAPSPSPSVALSDNISVTDTSNYYNSNQKHPDPTSPKSGNRNSNTTTPNTINNPDSPIISSATTPTSQQQQQQQQQGKEISRAVTPASSRLSPSSSFDFDPRISGVLHSLSPSQIQQLLASLASQTISDPTANLSSTSSLPPNSTINPSATTSSNTTGTNNGTLTPYLQPSSFDFSINPAPSAIGQPSSFSTISHMPLVSPDGLISFDPYDPSAPSAALRSPDLNLLDSGFNPNMGYPGGMGDLSSSSQEARDREHEERMHRQWQGAEDVDKEMSMVDSSIQSLIQTFGLDPSLLEDHVNANANLNLVHSLGPSVGLDDSGGGDAGGHPDDPTAPAVGTGMDMDMDPSQNPAVDFDFDTFFHNLSSSSAGAGPSTSNDNTGTGTGDAPIDYTDMVFLSDDPSGSPTTTAPTPTPTAPTTAPSTNSNLNININNLPTQRDRDRDLAAVSPIQSIRHVSPSPSLSVQSDYHANADDGRDDVSVSIGGDSSGLPTASTNLNSTTMMNTRKRKSEIDLDGLASALEGGSAQATTTTTAASGKTGTGKSKRRKDK